MRNSALRELILSDNSIGDEGAEALAAVLDSHSKIKVLDLSHNTIGTRGAVHIASAVLRTKSLTSLSLKANEIGDPGAEALLEALDASEKVPSALRRLDLSANPLGRRTWERFRAAFQQGSTVLHALHLGDAEPWPEDLDEGSGGPERFTVTCSRAGLEVRAGRPGPRAQVSWTQDDGVVEVLFQRAELRRCDARSLSCEFSTRRLVISVKGKPLMDLELYGRIRPEQSTWRLSQGALQVVLAKAEDSEWEDVIRVD